MLGLCCGKKTWPIRTVIGKQVSARTVSTEDAAQIEEGQEEVKNARSVDPLVMGMGGLQLRV